MSLSVSKLETQPATKPSPAKPADAKPSGSVLPFSGVRRGAAKAMAPKFMAMVLQRMVPPALMLVLLVGIWEIACSAPGSSLPPPSRVVSESWQLIVDPFFVGQGINQGMFWQILASLQRVALGYALAAIAGVALGTLVGQSVWAMRGLDPIFQVLRTVPPLAWLPLSLAAFRDGNPSAIFVIFITAIWPIIINTAVGIRNIPADYRNVARVLQLSEWTVMRKILFPAVLPAVLTGVRLSIGIAWLVIVAAEMLTGGLGIGFWIWNEWNNLNVENIIIAIVIIGVVGLLLEQGLMLLARRFSWQEK